MSSSPFPARNGLCFQTLKSQDKPSVFANSMKNSFSLSEENVSNQKLESETNINLITSKKLKLSILKRTYGKQSISSPITSSWESFMEVQLKWQAKRSWSLVVWLRLKMTKKIQNKLWMTMDRLLSWPIRHTFWMWPMVPSNVDQISNNHLIISTMVEIFSLSKIVSTPKVSESITSTPTRLH